jgi:hypothetical protein
VWGLFLRYTSLQGKGLQNSPLLHFRVVESMCQFCVAFCADSVDMFAAQVDVFELSQYSTNLVLFFAQ